MSTRIPITVARGDGIGPEIMEATLRILDAANAPLEYEHIDIGEKHLHVLGAGFQNGQGNIRISGLKHVKTSILQIVGRSHPNERLVFDQQDDRTVF